MSVKINLKLDAKGVEGRLVAISGALQTLEETSNDLDLDDAIDADSITGNISEVISKLEDLEEVSDRINKRLSEDIGDLDSEHTITHEYDTPDGSTGDGDSTGGDPPDKGRKNEGRISSFTGSFQGLLDHIGIEDIQSDTAEDISEEERLSRLSDWMGVDVKGVMDRKKFNEWKHDGASWAKNRTIGMTDREMAGLHEKMIRVDVGFGEESLKQAKERRAALSDEEYEKAKNEIGSDDLSLERRKEMARENITSNLEDMELLRARTDKDGNLDLETPETDMRAASDTDLGGRSIPSAFNKFDIDLDAMEIDDLEKRFGKMGSSVKKLVPDMSQLYAVIAAMIPIAAVLGAQLLGVASAMGAVGLAGLSIIGLGLIGHADSMAASLEQAKIQIGELAEESYNAFSGTAQLFAPIQARMFDAIPGQIARIATSMEGLTAYEDTLFQIGAMLSSGLQTSFRAIAENEDAISQLAIRFSQIIGTGIIEFFGWLFNEGQKNQDMLLSLGGTLKDLATVIFRVFRVLVMFLESFSPAIETILFLSSALNNELVQSLIGFVAAAYLTAGALSKMGLAALQAYGMMAGGGIVKAIQAQFWAIQAGITRLIAHYTSLSAAAASARAMMAMTGIGLLSVGAGYIGYKAMKRNSPDPNDYTTGGPNLRGGEGKTVYNDNRSYQVSGASGDDYASVKQVGKEIERASERDSATSPPNVDIK